MFKRDYMVLVGLKLWLTAISLFSGLHLSSFGECWKDERSE